MVVRPSLVPAWTVVRVSARDFTPVQWSDERRRDGKGIPDLPAGKAGKELLER
jgi:hypothetical protein